MATHVLFQQCAEHAHAPPIRLNRPQAEAPAHAACQHLALQPHQITKVVAHGGGCNDGFAAAIMAYDFNPRLPFHLTEHDALAALGPELAGHKVLFVDISPARELIDELTRTATEFIVIDHHASAQLALVTVEDRRKWFDMNQSGCGMAWRYFFGDAPMPRLFQAIQARDLWRKDDVEECDAVMAGLRCSTPQCAACWARHSHSIDEIVSIGRCLERNRRVSIAAYVKAARPRMLSGMRVWLVNCTDPTCTSDAGAALVERDGCHEDVALLFRYDADTRCYWVSMRSRQGTGPDVSVICTRFGGGGHRHAAGFTYAATRFEDLFDAEQDSPKRACV